MQTDLSIYNSLRPSFIEGVHAVKFNALSAVISRYRDYARSSEQIKAYSGDSLLMRVQSPNQKIPDRKTKCVIKTHINIKQNVIFGAKLKPV